MATVGVLGALLADLSGREEATWKVAEMKKALTFGGVDIDGVADKSELVSLTRDLVAKQPPPPAVAADEQDATQDTSEGERKAAAAAASLLSGGGASAFFKNAGSEEIKEKHKEIEGICAPIISKHYGAGGGAGGAGGDDDDDDDDDEAHDEL